MEKTLIDTIVVKQDVGGPYTQYKKAILQFWSDGTVTWVARSAEKQEKHPNAFYIGDTPWKNN